VLGYRLPDEGALFVISGPSGVGKSTLVSAALAAIPGLAFSVSATTRQPRHNEQDGVDYHFLTDAQFATRLAAGDFLEHATVYDRSYGTLRTPTEAALASGRSLILDIDVQGARQVRGAWADAVHIFIVPPSVAVLEARLRARGTDSDEAIARRMRQVAQQLDGAREFDFLVVNDDIEVGHRCLQAVLLGELCRRSRRSSIIRDIDDQLLANDPVAHDRRRGG
jgi:guanylate kinase